MATSGARPTVWPPRLVGGGLCAALAGEGGPGGHVAPLHGVGTAVPGGAPCGLWAQIDRAPPWRGKRGFGDPRGYVDPLHGKRGPQPVGMAPLPHPFCGASAQGCGWGLRPASGTPATRPCWGSPRLPMAPHPFVWGGGVCWAAPSPLIDAVSPGGSPGPINRACVRRAVPRRSTMAGHWARPTALGHLPTPRSSGQTPLTPPHPRSVTLPGPLWMGDSCAHPHPAAPEGLPLPTPSPAAGAVTLRCPRLLLGDGVGGCRGCPHRAVPWASQPAACAHRARVSGAAASVQLRARAARWGRLRQRRVPGTPERGYLLLGSAAARPQL